MSIQAINPIKLDGGNISAQTNADGTTYTAFANTPCNQVLVANFTGTTIEVQQDGAGVALPIADKGSVLFRGISNANRLAVRRTDTSTTQVTVAARWEK